MRTLKFHYIQYLVSCKDRVASRGK